MEKKNSNLKSFYILLAGQTVSQLGTSMTGFALIIWAYTQKGEVMASSLLAVCSTVPFLLVSLFGGAVADHVNKKKIMLVCDTAAAAGSLLVWICLNGDVLQLWILCVVNVISGFMNAFQNPASQVAVSLLIDPKDYARAGGLQAALGSGVGILTPILAAGLLGFGGLKLILLIDLLTFAFAFATLLFFVRIPDMDTVGEKNGLHEIFNSMRTGFSFLKQQQGLLYLLLMYSVLEFMGAVSFDSMYSPLVLARTGNNELAVGLVSSFMAAGCVAASVVITLMKQPERKMRVMYAGSFLCLTGILFFGMGRNIYQWCAIVFCGCFGAPVYHTYQTVLLREKVPIRMQGRIFSLQGMITEMLAPVGYLAAAVLADYVCEPFMSREGKLQSALSVLVGKGSGSGIGLIFVAAGLTGMLLLLVLSRSPKIRGLEEGSTAQADTEH